jgi:hypothetical protein
VFVVSTQYILLSVELAKHKESELTAHALDPLESGSRNHQMKEPNGGNTLLGHVEALGQAEHGETLGQEQCVETPVQEVLVDNIYDHPGH